jgi:electron transport complex protein RnfE
MKPSLKSVFIQALSNQQAYVVMLGLCTALATTSSLSLGVATGLIILVSMSLTNPLISLLRRFTSEDNKLLVYVLITSGVVSLVSLLTAFFFPFVHEQMGIYLPLVAVNCILVTRLEVVAAQDKVTPSLVDALGTGLSYFGFLILFSGLRELIASGQIGWMGWFSGVHVFSFRVWGEDVAMPFFYQPMGAFLLLGLYLGFSNFINLKRGRRYE